MPIKQIEEEISMERILKEMEEIKGKDQQDADDVIRSLDLLGEALDIQAVDQQEQLKASFSIGYVTGALVTAGLVIVGAIIASKK